jgi:superoxide reductase
MAKKAEVFVCEVCGNIIEVVHAGPGALVCCGQTMKLLVENTTDAAKEKHVPVIEKLGEGIKVSVGSIAHPMEDKHYIEWIEILDKDTVYRRYLVPGAKPEAEFPVNAQPVRVREYCTLHGLWESKS